jgi:hypothetical protein
MKQDKISLKNQSGINLKNSKLGTILYNPRQVTEFLNKSLLEKQETP